MFASTTFALALVGSNVAFAATTSYATRPPVSTIQPALSSIYAAQATAVPLSPVSNVKGAAFDRIVQIWLENTDYDKAAADPNMQWLASQGILLTNYFAATHPSEPNYIAVVGGDNFGMDNDDFNHVPSNISTVVDLLDTKGISWGEYQEDMPYPGYLGFNFTNQQNTSRNDYVRKHNPLIIYDSVTSNATRLSLIKNFTSFGSDLAAQTLPQWSFMTPNMTNDGHDTTVTFTANWARTFLEPLLNNSYFMNNTLVVLTFDEDDTYTEHNNVFTVLLWGAIPTSLHNTTDSTFYNHYSMLSTVELNWGLPSLGRWDCNANVLALVANKTGYSNQKVDITSLFFNSSYPGPLSDAEYIPVWPVPTNGKCAAGSILSSVVSTWGTAGGSRNYTNVYPYDAASNNNVASSPSSSASGGSTGTPTSTSSSPSATTSKPSAANMNMGFSWIVLLGLAGIVSFSMM